MEPINPNFGRQEEPNFGGSAAQHHAAGTSVLEQGKEKAADLIDQAKNIASETMETVRQSYSQLGERLQEGGEYLREQAVEGAEQVTGLVRRNPVPALLISFCAGFFLCRWLKD